MGASRNAKRPAEDGAAVARVAELPAGALQSLLGPYGLQVEQVAPDAAIPGSFWGEPEAGLVGNRLLVRADTPVHSALHEAGHYICMAPARRRGLHTDAGGDDLEEVAVCYLQVLLADALEGYDRARILGDMDAWGYSFRLGSTAAWLATDAADARDWLRDHGLVDSGERPVGRVRQR